MFIVFALAERKNDKRQKIEYYMNADHFSISIGVTKWEHIPTDIGA